MRHMVYPQVLSIILLLIIQVIFIMPSDADVNLPSITTQDQTPSNVWLQFPSNSSRIVRFTANISANNPGDIHIEVQLKLTVGGGWDANVIPKQMMFNKSSTQKAVITVTVPGNITMDTNVNVYLNATGQYPNMTIPLESISHSIIYLEHNHAYEVTYKFVKQNSYTNKIAFSITDKGNFDDNIVPEFLNHASGAQADVKFDVSNTKISPNSLPGKIIMTAQYGGPDYPMNQPLEIRFYPQSSIQTRMPYGMRYFVSINITLSFKAPDKPQLNYLFVGAIMAFIIIMVVVMALVVRRSSKGKK